MRDNLQNTVSTTAIKKYNDFCSVRMEILEWFKDTNSEGKSAWVSAIRKRVESITLYYIKIDIMETTTNLNDHGYISSSLEIKGMEYNSEFLRPPTMNHVFCENEALDNTMVHGRLVHAMDENVDKINKLDTIPMNH